MNNEKQIGKIAADKENRKLGKIIKVEIVEDPKTKIKKPFFLILVSKAFKKGVVILLETEKIMKTDNYYVWFDIQKKDFDNETKETRELMRIL